MAVVIPKMIDNKLGAKGSEEKVTSAESLR